MKAITRALLIGLLFVGSAYADDPTKTTDTTKTNKDTTAKKEKLTPAELQVMAHYKDVNMTEIDLGKVAKKQGGTAAVKSYGEMMVKDHGAMDKQLKDLAKMTKQTIPAEKMTTDAEKQAQAEMKKDVAALKKLKGADFDRAYIQMMIDGHEREVSNIDSKMAEVNNPELKTLLTDLKPQLQHHEDAAKELQKNNAQAMNQPHTNQPQAKQQPRK
ncbi:MAG TPA: DUF4142 domain-containing protein [Kofleriaceae bacterium]|nr:DUF4142 domain-containing protein [Kofleriaceae bacterium]